MPELPIARSAGLVIDDGESWILQLRSNKDGIWWPGKVALWGGAMEMQDEGSFLKNALRELQEETGLESTEVHITPLRVISYERQTKEGELVLCETQLFNAKLLQPTFFHVYEGEGIFRIPKSSSFDQIDTSNFAPGVVEALEQLEIHDQ